MTIPIREAETARHATQVGTLSAYCQYTISTKVSILSVYGTPCGSKHIPTEAQKQIEGSILLPVTGWEMEPQNIQLKT